MSRRKKSKKFKLSKQSKALNLPKMKYFHYRKLNTSDFPPYPVALCGLLVGRLDQDTSLPMCPECRQVSTKSYLAYVIGKPKEKSTKKRKKLTIQIFAPVIEIY
jgi:hypothetical protein